MPYREIGRNTAKCYRDGREAANANMRLHGRTSWNRDDYNIAQLISEVCLFGKPEVQDGEDEAYLYFCIPNMNTGME